MLGCLENLQSSLTELGMALQWRRGEHVREVVRAAREWNVDRVYWNRDYARARLSDRDVQQQLAELNISVQTFKDLVVFEAGDVKGQPANPCNDTVPIGLARG